jgi:arylsulfatase A-like enzyme
MFRTKLFARLGLVFLGFLLGCKSPDTAPPPNILLFFVDDLGWQDTSVPFWNQKTPLNQRYHTPNMERLSAMGVKFTNAYSTPVCSPSRISLMTGMNAARHRVTNWTLQPDILQPMETNHPNLEFPMWNVNGLATQEGIPHAALATPLPQLLKESGYTTLHVGKGHFGALGYPSANPEHIGFEINIAGHAAGAPSSYLGLDNFGNGNPKQTIWAVPGLEAYHGKDIFLTEALTQETLKSLQPIVDQKQPFFLYFSLYGVHAPLMADQRFIDRYQAANLDPEEAKYASMIESMDHALGRLLDFINENEIAEHTIVLFMSDNGGLSAVARGGEKHTHNAPLKSGKGSIYEGGIRVPMLAYWPGLTSSNTSNDQPIIIEDFFPTLLEMAAIKTPKTIQKIDGKSFVGLLKNETPSSERPLFWHYPNAWGPKGPGIGSYSAVRKGDWKLIYFHEDQRFELYNLALDIGEEENRSLDDQEKTLELAQLLTDHLKSTNAQMPRLKRTGEQVPHPIDAISSGL